MRRAIGIGGIFFKAQDPAALRAWYKEHLGIDVLEWGGAVIQRGEYMMSKDRGTIPAVEISVDVSSRV